VGRRSGKKRRDGGQETGCWVESTFAGPKKRRSTQTSWGGGWGNPRKKKWGENKNQLGTPRVKPQEELGRGRLKWDETDFAAKRIIEEDRECSALFSEMLSKLLGAESRT